MILAICDDDKEWLENTLTYIEEYGQQEGLALEIYTYSDGQSLLNHDGKPLEAIFLDIQIGKESGIEVAKNINDKWKNCQIVYITNFLYYARNVYETEHTYFVLKDELKTRLPDVFKRLSHNQRQYTQKLVFSTVGGTSIILNPHEILSFERIRRHTIIETESNQYVVTEKLDKIMTMVSTSDFVRCHNSYIIYFPAVREKHRDYFVMNNGKVIQISRKYIQPVKEAFEKWALLQIL
ncbi:MAG: LytTR family DNA-binding domain-containing protein [Lachnospiraceae bacterium]|nr:LytTR family DNA-binding domain-containing protein [Lachnospiraceae bacterium]